MFGTVIFAVISAAVVWWAVSLSLRVDDAARALERIADALEGFEVPDLEALATQASENVDRIASAQENRSG